MKKLNVVLALVVCGPALANYEENNTLTYTLHHDLLHGAVREAHNKQNAQSSDAKTPFSFSLSQSSQYARNHFSFMDSTSKGTTTSMSFDMSGIGKWDLGLNYSLIKGKTITYYSQGVARSGTHALTPYGTYHLTPEVYVSMYGSAIASKLSISQMNIGRPMKGVGRSFSWLAGTSIGAGKLFGIWYPSVSAGGFFYGSKTKSFAFDDGNFAHAQRTQFWQADLSAQLNVMVHPNFQPYAKLGQDILLRRTSNYLIKTRDGWTWAAGANFFNSKTINASFEGRYQKQGSGAKQTTFMLKLGARF